MSNINLDSARKALAAYSSIGCVRSIVAHGSGHINSTFQIDAQNGLYILQRINDYVFKDPRGVMDNILKIGDYLRQKTSCVGGDVKRCTLNVIFTDSGDPLTQTEDGYWRMYEFVRDSISYDVVSSAVDFKKSARAFGEFQRLLVDFPAHTLCEPIKDFHNTPVRYDNFIKALKANKSGRAHLAAKEIEFVKQREHFASALEEAHASGRLPLRVTHNDTKLNNILFDAKTGDALCIIDLDTVSPGYSVTDFGDAIRFGANTAAEDEKDLSLVGLDLELFAAYAEGFIEGCGGSLEPEEIKLLPVGAMMMTFECGMRFLTDYLDGDVYFRTEYPEHNLVRCRNQFALLADMERKRAQMDSYCI